MASETGAKDLRPDAGIRLARRVFTVAGWYGLVTLVPLYFLENRVGRDFPPPITHPEHYYGFVGVALAWQVLFLIMARDPVRYRVAMIPAILEKLSWSGACVALYIQGRLSSVVLGTGVLDLIFAALFVASYRATGAVRRGR
ncbi:MAG TPA: hypothetical protein VLB00_09540 [Gemmatimonadales bacterium]|nr:hypothetical protein [Gemmatimonadales bacterium]